MFPGYGNMDSYTQHLPHIRDHIPSPNHYHPNWEPTPLHMNMDSFNHPSPYVPWPYNNHSCCNHSYPPGYHTFRPPCFHHQYPPQGPYPPYPTAYPPFFIPPQFDHARFEYDKDKNHCCGCPNHISHRKEGSNVKIEEQNDAPTIEEVPKTMPKDNHSSLIQYPYNYYPMMWLPNNGSSDGKIEKMMESLPILNFKDLGKGQGKSTHQGDDKVLQLQYPIFCMPSNDKPEESVKDKEIDTDTITKGVEDGPSKVKIVPFKFLDNENSALKPGVVEKEAKNQNQHSIDRVAEEESKIKTIPVMHLDSSNGEKLNLLERPKNVLKDSVADAKRHDVATNKDVGKKQPSPSKTSKLPPVCLRVEPLPKKSGSNGKGRSPSPPSLKDGFKVDCNNNGHVAVMKKDSDKTPIKDIKFIDVKYQPSGEGGKKDRKDATVDVSVQVNGNVSDNKEEREDFYTSQEQNGEKVDTSENNEKPVQKNYSPEDAALLIQSAFRGFNVRRWKPLEKLREIAKIRGKVADVKNQIQNYEGSLELDVKQKVILSETIMNLLLQLDTVQGLLPSLREVRKSVASDLVYLQDKLDQLYSQAAIKHEEETQKKNENSSTNSAVSDTTECSIVEDEVQEPVCPNHVIPITILNDEMVPSGDEYYQALKHEDDNLLSIEGKASIDENSVSQDVAELSSENEASDFVLKQHENPLEEQINEVNKQSLVEDLASKATLESEEGSNLELLGARDGKAIEEESNVVGDASAVSEELMEKSEANEESEMNESTETKAESWIESLATPIQINNSQQLAEVSSGIAEEETKLPLSVKEDTEMIELCGESVAAPVQEMSSETPAVETSFITEEKKLVEDNGKLRQILEKLLRAGEEQMEVIADLNARVRNLERKLSKRKKVKVNQKKLNKFSHSVGGKDTVLSYEQLASSAA